MAIEKGKRIGAAIENPGFIENETILYNLKYLYSLKNNYTEEVEKNIKILCEKFHLDLYSNEKMKNYSVGMRQKTSIIQAIMEDQKIILFDEPTNGLDDASVLAFYDIVKELKKQGKMWPITQKIPEYDFMIVSLLLPNTE